MSKLAALLAGAALLGACEARIGNDAPPVEANASATGKAEEGRLTVSAEGFNMSIDIPEALRDDTRMDGDNELIYPGANFGGLHVQGGADRPGGGHEGEDPDHDGHRTAPVADAGSPTSSPRTSISPILVVGGIWSSRQPRSTT